MFKITIISFREFILSPARNKQINQSNNSQPERGEEVCYLLNNTVIARVLVQLGFTEVNHNIRQEAIEAGEDEEQSDHPGDVGWLAVNS